VLETENTYHSLESPVKRFARRVEITVKCFNKLTKQMNITALSMKKVINSLNFKAYVRKQKEFISRMNNGTWLHGGIPTGKSIPIDSCESSLASKQAKIMRRNIVKKFNLKSLSVGKYECNPVKK